ncbi:hypothetical protein AB0F17_45950 [Nonomuraea sp. NPDC026600]|uniref:hypothetical protein n=1 Tax=Nonomuraea sp. NPDC026600 TaxID=3155363 RepID=UPI00340682C8
MEHCLADRAEDQPEPTSRTCVRGYSSVGNNDDRVDAFVLTDILRTAGPGCGRLATATLQATVRAHRDLVTHRTAADPTAGFRHMGNFSTRM